MLRILARFIYRLEDAKTAYEREWLFIKDKVENKTASYVFASRIYIKCVFLYRDVNLISILYEIESITILHHIVFHFVVPKYNPIYIV